MQSYFNPHEREARDDETMATLPTGWILIHTSVKLVTEPRALPFASWLF